MINAVGLFLARKLRKSMNDLLYFSDQLVSPFIKKSRCFTSPLSFQPFTGPVRASLFIFGLRIVHAEFTEAEDNFTPIGRKCVWQFKLLLSGLSFSLFPKSVLNSF